MTFAKVMAALLLATAIAALIRRFPALVRSTLPSRGDRSRWESRPVLGAAVVATAHLIPLVAAVVVPLGVSRHLTRPSGWGATIATWTFLFALSVAVVFVVERVARRLLPLGALLKLSLAFPDRAPRRLAVARRAGGVRDLQARLQRARTMGIEDEPARAAETILMLVAALHAHDRRTRGHAERVRVFTDLLADELRIAPDDRDRLRWAALLHDIGKVHVPAKILNKAGPPTGHEWDILRRHPLEGARLAAPLFSWLGEWSLTIEQHHERWDGKGYPHGLRGTAISYGARVVGVADSFDAMTAGRSYQRSRSAAAARRELTEQAGHDFDPTVVRAFLNISIGRLRWVLGPLSWLGQAPLVRWLPQAAEGVMTAGADAGTVIGTATGAAVIATGSALVAGHAAASAVQPVSATGAALAVRGGTPSTTAPGTRRGDGAGNGTTTSSPPAAGTSAPGQAPPTSSVDPAGGASDPFSASPGTGGATGGTPSSDGTSPSGDNVTSMPGPLVLPSSPAVGGDVTPATTTTTTSPPSGSHPVSSTPTTLPALTTATTLPPVTTPTTLPTITTATTLPPVTTLTTLPTVTTITTVTTLPALPTDTTLLTVLPLPTSTSTSLLAPFAVLTSR